MTNLTNLNIKRLLALSEQEIVDRLTCSDAPTLDLLGLGLGKSASLLSNATRTNNPVLSASHEYLFIIARALPLFDKGERMLAELMNSLVDIHHGEDSLTPGSGEQDLDLRTSLIEIAAQLAGHRRPLYKLGQRLLPLILAAEVSSGTLSLHRCVCWTFDAIGTLVTGLTHRDEVVDDVAAEIEIIRTIRAETLRTSRVIAIILADAGNNGINLTGDPENPVAAS